MWYWLQEQWAVLASGRLENGSKPTFTNLSLSQNISLDDSHIVSCSVHRWYFVSELSLAVFPFLIPTSVLAAVLREHPVKHSVSSQTLIILLKSGMLYKTVALIWPQRLIFKMVESLKNVSGPVSHILTETHSVTFPPHRCIWGCLTGIWRWSWKSEHKTQKSDKFSW